MLRQIHVEMMKAGVDPAPFYAEIVAKYEALS
jgi:hypothetical protein